MYRNFLVMIVVLSVFLGCSSKNNPYAKPTDLLHEQAIMMSKKAIITVNKDTKVYLVATYISNIDNKLLESDENVENFIVSTRINSDDNKMLYDNMFFALNNVEEGCITELKIDDELLTLLPSINAWSRYFLIESSKDISKKGVRLSVNISDVGSAHFKFSDDYGDLPAGDTITFTNLQN